MPGKKTKRFMDDCVPQIEAIRARKFEFHALAKGDYPGERMAEDILPGLNSIGFWDCRRPQDWGLREHHNEGLEFVFLESGEVGFQVDGESHRLTAGQLTFTRPWQRHKLGDPNLGRGRLHWLILDIGARGPSGKWTWPPWILLVPADRKAFAHWARTGNESVWQAGPGTRSIFRNMAEAIRNWDQPGAVSRLGIAVNRLLCEVLELARSDATARPAGRKDHGARVDAFLARLADDAELCGRQWTIGEIAAACGVGITTLAKYCAEQVNISPVGYLNQCRAEHAARLLLSRPDLPVTEVAMACGFNSSQYFATAFRRVHRMTPSEWKARATDQ